MKKKTLTLAAVLSAIILFAQPPQTFKYQAVVRDSIGIVLSNQNVSFQISILKGSASGTLIYSEIHDTITNEFGIINLEIGNGEVTSGDFTIINWGIDSYFLQIEMDATESKNYLFMGTSQLLTVPYALHASGGGDPSYQSDENSPDSAVFVDNSGNIGIGTSNPDASALLELNSSSKGFLLPRLTLAEIEAITGPEDGLTVYNTDDKRFYFFDGYDNYWKEIAIGESIINESCGFITDTCGNIYNTVLIGTQCWMKENLATTKYRDGTNIPHVTDGTAWSGLTTPGYCWYNNDSATYGYTYGALYNFYAATTTILCPIGWHVATDVEWTTLANYLGGEYVAGGKLKETGTTHWNSPNTEATNVSGFTALPGGDRSYFDGLYYTIGNYGHWWTASGVGQSAWKRSMSSNNAFAYRGFDIAGNGYSVRCIKD